MKLRISFEFDGCSWLHVFLRAIPQKRPASEAGAVKPLHISSVSPYLLFLHLRVFSVSAVIFPSVQNIEQEHGGGGEEQDFSDEQEDRGERGS